MKASLRASVALALLVGLTGSSCLKKKKAAAQFNPQKEVSWVDGSFKSQDQYQFQFHFSFEEQSVGVQVFERVGLHNDPDLPLDTRCHYRMEGEGYSITPTTQAFNQKLESPVQKRYLVTFKPTSILLIPDFVNYPECDEFIAQQEELIDAGKKEVSLLFGRNDQGEMVMNSRILQEVETVELDGCLQIAGRFTNEGLKRNEQLNVWKMENCERFSITRHTEDNNGCFQPGREVLRETDGRRYQDDQNPDKFFSATNDESGLELVETLEDSITAEVLTRRTSFFELNQWGDIVLTDSFEDLRSPQNDRESEVIFYRIYQ